MREPEYIIEIENLKKYYKTVKAVDGISFKVKRGELFAFLGVNGAGKSTTINVISGILRKDEGKVEVCGYDIDKNSAGARQKVGVVFQNSVLDKKLTVYDNLKYRANLYGIFGEQFKSRLNCISDMFDLGQILKRPLEKLSGGQKRRVDIARALIHKPELLILDEPTTGLDPKTRITVWNVIEKMRKEENLTVFLTTHYMEESSVADYVVILDSGKIVSQGTPHKLKSDYSSDFLRIYKNIEAAEKYFASKGRNCKRIHDRLEVEFENTEQISEEVKLQPQLFTDFEVVKGDMDNVFLKVTGKQLKDV